MRACERDDKCPFPSEQTTGNPVSPLASNDSPLAHRPEPDTCTCSLKRQFSLPPWTPVGLGFKGTSEDFKLKELGCEQDTVPSALTSNSSSQQF